MVEQGKIEKSLKSNEFASFAQRTSELKERVVEKIMEYNSINALENVNREALNSAITTYSWYMLGETAVVMILCLLQVEGIRRMLSSSSVV